jgi:hypothetical protein
MLRDAGMQGCMEEVGDTTNILHNKFGLYSGRKNRIV